LFAVICNPSKEEAMVAKVPELEGDCMAVFVSILIPLPKAPIPLIIVPVYVPGKSLKKLLVMDIPLMIVFDKSIIVGVEAAAPLASPPSKALLLIFQF
jgi:hypothetical protein